MKKGLTILVAIMSIMAIIAVDAGASDLIIGREVEISGVGVINTDLALDTTSDFSGLTLSERISTPGGGFKDASEMRYFSSFEIGMYNNNDTVNSSSELEYESVAEIINARRTVYSRNYNLGTVMGMKLKGSSAQEISMFLDDYSSTAEIEGETAGRLKLFEKIIDTEDRHSVLVYDVIVLDGTYKVIWNTYAEEDVYPAEGVDENWLSCP